MALTAPAPHVTLARSMCTPTHTRSATAAARTGAQPRRTHRPSAPTTGGELRLTARGRAAAFGASVLALAVLVVGVGQVVEAASAPAAGSSEPAVVVVQGGDTLWAIAQEVAPGQDPRGVVRQIRELNELGTRAIVPGQALVIPTRG